MTGLFPVPSSWVWGTLGEIADVVGGVTKDSKKQNDPDLPLVPYLRVANVQRGYLDLSRITEIRVPEATLERLHLIEGDVLLNEGGDRDKIGRGWIWNGEIPDCIHQNHVFRARVRQGVLHPKLLAWYANECARDWFMQNAKQSVNLASISLTRIKQLPVPVPPLAEQEHIVAALEDYLSRVVRLEKTVAVVQLKADSLRRSLLSDAFAGRLVQRNPADEPVAELLERIGAEQAARANVSRDRSSRAKIRGAVQEELPG